MVLSGRKLALWVTPVGNLAGVGRHLLDVAAVGVPDWELCFAVPPGPLLDRLRDLGANVIPAEIGVGVRTDRAVAELRRIIKTVRPQIVHSHLARADILSAMASLGLAVKLVSTEHHIPPDRFMFHPSLLRAKSMEFVHRRRLRRFSALIAVSASTKRDMLTYWKPRQPVTVILNGVDRPANPAQHQPGYRFLSLARLSPEKNIEMSLRAFAGVRAKCPQAKLTVAGSGESAASLQQLAAELQLADSVDFAGFVDAEQALASHDVVLQPSKSDNCSYTLLDAVALGLGVAASPIGGNPEILPAHCIAGLDDLPGFIQVAMEQASRPERRPALPEQVPTREKMTAAVARVYSGTI